MSKHQESRQPLMVRLTELVHRYLPSVHVDKTFQRRVCWSLGQKQSFVVNLLKQHEAGTFSFAEAQSGLDRSRDESHASSIKKYEGVLARSKNYISLDAQNRGVATEEYYSGKFGITATLNSSGQEFILEDCKYSDLPIAIKALLDNTQMIVIVFNNFLYGDLNQIFLSINDGLPMVDQEKRNSINSWISTELLNKAESKYHHILERVVKPDDILRMGDVELLLKVLVATHEQFKWTSTNSKTLNQFYRVGLSKTRNEVSNYHNNHTQRFYKIMDNVSNILKAPKHKNLQRKSGSLPNQMFWAAVIISEYLVDNNLMFTKAHGLDLDVIVYELDKNLQNRGDQNRAEALQLFQSGKGPEPSRGDYYDAWVSLPHQKPAFVKRKQEITSEFSRKYSEILQTRIMNAPKVAANV